MWLWAHIHRGRLFWVTWCVCSFGCHSEAESSWCGSRTLTAKQSSSLPPYCMSVHTHTQTYTLCMRILDLKILFSHLHNLAFLLLPSFFSPVTLYTPIPPLSMFFSLRFLIYKGFGFLLQYTLGPPPPPHPLLFMPVGKIIWGQGASVFVWVCIDVAKLCGA